MRALFAVLLVPVITTLLATAPAEAQEDNQYDGVIGHLLDYWKMDLFDRGYSPDREVITGRGGSPTEFERFEYNLNFSAGEQYAIALVCELSCSRSNNLILVFDSSGSAKSSSGWTSLLPGEINKIVAEFTPSYSGSYTIRVTIWRCSPEPCSYALGVFKK